MSYPDPSSLLLTAMAALAFLAALLPAAGLFAAGLKRPALVVLAATVLLASGQHFAAASGYLRDFERRPPPLMLLIAVTVLITLSFALSPLGRELARRTSFTWLIASQVFRLPLELTMNRASREGVMPIQMSFEGRNFDILTGVSAIVVAILVAGGLAGPLAIRLWNIAGFGLLANIVAVAIASFPLFGVFGPDRLNLWVADPVFVWLPGILVQAALLGHILIWRKLALSSGPEPAKAGAAS